MKRLTHVQALPGYKLQLRFEDGVAGEVDLSAEAGKGIFGCWGDPGHFALAKLGHAGRSLEWPDGVDLCADALYLEITGRRVEDLFPNWESEVTHA